MATGPSKTTSVSSQRQPRFAHLEKDLGLKPGMTRQQRETLLAQAESIPAIKALVAEYRSCTETLGLQQTVQQGTEKQEDDIVTAAQKVGAGGTAENADDIRRWLGRFMARNQSDFSSSSTSGSASRWPSSSAIARPRIQCNGLPTSRRSTRPTASIPTIPPA